MRSVLQKHNFTQKVNVHTYSGS